MSRQRGSNDDHRPDRASPASGAEPEPEPSTGDSASSGEAADAQVAEVRAALAAYPHLSHAFDTLFAACAARDDIGVLMSGSFVNGQPDALSDLDIELVVRPGADVAGVRAWIEDLVSGLGPVLAGFPADHLGLDNLLVFFLAQDDRVQTRVLKIDIWVMTTDELPYVPKARVLRDPGGFVAHHRRMLQGDGNAGSVSGREAGPPIDFADLQNKLCGWAWFTYVKIARGHLLEAMESLDFMRSRALLPCLLLAEDLPMEGYRLLDLRLSAARRAALYQTFPTRHEPAALMHSLDAMLDLFLAIRPVVAGKLGHGQPAADLEGMRQLIRDHEQRGG